MCMRAPSSDADREHARTESKVTALLESVCAYLRIRRSGVRVNSLRADVYASRAALTCECVRADVSRKPTHVLDLRTGTLSTSCCGDVVREFGAPQGNESAIWNMYLYYPDAIRVHMERIARCVPNAEHIQVYERYIGNVSEEIRARVTNADTAIVVSSLNTGKSRLLQSVIKTHADAGRRVLICTHRRSLASEISRKCGDNGLVVLDYRSPSLSDDASRISKVNECNVCVCQIDSLDWFLYRGLEAEEGGETVLHRFACLVVDEIESLICHVGSSDTLSKHRGTVVSTLCRVMAEADHCICLDGTMSERTVKIVCAMREASRYRVERVHKEEEEEAPGVWWRKNTTQSPPPLPPTQVRPPLTTLILTNTYPGLDRRELSVCTSESAFLNLVINTLRADPDARVAIPCTSKVSAEMIATALQSEFPSVLLITADSSEELRRADPNEAWSTPRTLIYTGVIDAGLSYDNADRPFKAVFLHVHGVIGPSSLQITQMLGRIRTPTDTVYHAYIPEYLLSQPFSTPTTPTEDLTHSIWASVVTDVQAMSSDQYLAAMHHFMHITLHASLDNERSSRAFLASLGHYLSLQGMRVTVHIEPRVSEAASAISKIRHAMKVKRLTEEAHAIKVYKECRDNGGDPLIASPRVREIYNTMSGVYRNTRMDPTAFMIKPTNIHRYKNLCALVKMQHAKEREFGSGEVSCGSTEDESLQQSELVSGSSSNATEEGARGRLDLGMEYGAHLFESFGVTNAIGIIKRARKPGETVNSVELNSAMQGFANLASRNCAFEGPAIALTILDTLGCRGLHQRDYLISAADIVAHKERIIDKLSAWRSHTLREKFILTHVDRMLGLVRALSITNLRKFVMALSSLLNNAYGVSFVRINQKNDASRNEYGFEYSIPWTSEYDDTAAFIDLSPRNDPTFFEAFQQEAEYRNAKFVRAQKRKIGLT